MKRLIILGLTLAMTQHAMAEGSYQREALAKQQEERAFMRKLCGETHSSQFSSLFGGPDNYDYYFPTLGKFASEIESIQPFNPIVKAGVYDILKDAAMRRKQAVISRDHNRRLYSFSEERFERGGWGDTTKEALRESERKTAESLTYITQRALDDSEDYMKSFEIWIPERKAGLNSKKSGQLARNNYLSSARDGGAHHSNHYSTTPHQFLQACRTIWSRVTY